ncbi:hypothetical protein BDA99DRAFT_314967 [Phascolomyces articulosus]|uniref:Reverse transcriptase zinc-binding domain-containing protein n=1 Tax=Phascolomyces articulosus TaxID=60185 RepID=A0AAD5JVG8_9FUNG|nr:hypothetical protein BDA99DRAFT_314967 [Phascolomyces articulosus]
MAGYTQSISTDVSLDGNSSPVLDKVSTAFSFRLICALTSMAFYQIVLNNKELSDKVEQHRPCDPPLNSKPWSRFWNLDIRYQARNFWFRTLHHKLSCRRVLHKLLPHEYPSPLCPICSNLIDDEYHFIYWYPRKWLIWKEVLQDLLLIPIS